MRWMATQRIYMVILCIVMGCADESDISSGPSPTDNSRLFYPSYCFSLPVPWIPQIPPGSDWNNTFNCGQAVCVMIGGYYNNGAVSPWVIDAENNYLKCPTPYGCGTSAETLKRLLWDFHRVSSTIYHGRTADDVINEVSRGHPTIVGVKISEGRLTSGYGRSHWALAVGWDGNVILHDPGSNTGRYIRYSVDDFERSWATQNKVYIPTWK